jgi:hypothetical protein
MKKILQLMRAFLILDLNEKQKESHRNLVVARK